MRNESPNEYIHKYGHDDSFDNEKLGAALERLSKPIGVTEYQKSGEVRLENPPFILEFTYTSVSEDTSQLFSRRDERGVDPKTLREITTWKLTRTDRNVSLTLSDLVPKGNRVFFSPSTQNWTSYLVMDEGDVRVVLSGDIATPEIIIHFVHEAGHIHEEPEGPRFSRESQNYVRSKIDTVDLAEQLLSERNSWAFGLKKLKPFLDRDETQNYSIQKSDVMILVRQMALRSYQESIKGDMQGRVAMSHFDQDYDYLLEDDGAKFGI